jgi:hypothetical protein
MLIYWFLGTTPIAALALDHMYESKRFRVISRVGFFLVMFFLTIAGGIDVFKYAIAPTNGWKEFTTEEIELAKRISAETPPFAVFLNAPIHNHLVFLSGRKSLMGFPGHVWSHGYSDSYGREQDIKKMLKGGNGAASLINKYKPDFVTIGPNERRIGANKRFYNENLFDRNYTCIITTKNYKIYDLTKKKQPVVSSNEYLHQKDKHTVSGQGDGLYVCYYNNMDWNGEPIYQEIDSEIEFNWSNDDEKPLFSPFSAIWNGYIDIKTPGKYTFKLTSDDGSWLYIDDTLVIDNGGNHATKSVAGTVTLEPGKHKIMIKYFDAGGGAIINLAWVPPGGVEGKIPVERLKVKD